MPGESSRYSDALRTGRRRGLSSSPVKVKNFLHIVQTGSGAHTASYPLDSGSNSLKVNQPGREAAHSHPTSAEVRKMYVYKSISAYALMT
jgi:hypothetical protein